MGKSAFSVGCVRCQGSADQGSRQQVTGNDWQHCAAANQLAVTYTGQQGASRPLAMHTILDLCTLPPALHSLMTAPRSMAGPAFSWMEVKMRADAPTALSAYVIKLSWPVPPACRLVQI